MADSKLPSNDSTGEKYEPSYDERCLTDEEALQIDLRKEIRILMIGKTGVGKSATCNTMTGTSSFNSACAGKSVTKKGKLGKMKWQGKCFKIVDTPGLFDNVMSEKDLKIEIIKCLTLILPGPHIIMYVIRVGRFTKEDIETTDKCLKILDENPYKFMIIVMTGKDDLDFDGKTPEQYLESVTPNSTLLQKNAVGVLFLWTTGGKKIKRNGKRFTL